MLHGDQVVELSVLLGVHQEGEVEEDGEGQVDVEREEVEVKERRSWMACGWDEDLKNILSHEVRVTHTSKDEDCALYVPCSRVVQLARVDVRVLVLVDVICVMLVVLIARVDIHDVSTQFS